MPGPIGIDLRGPEPVVRCNRCEFRQVVADYHEGQDVAHDHIVANHPEITQP